MGLPLAIGIASHGLINLVDLALVGQLGPDAIRAAHVASTWNFLPMLVGQCVSTALLARLAMRLGAGERDAARREHLVAEWWMLRLAGVVAFVSAATAPWQVAAGGLEGDVAAAAVHYLVVSNLGCIPMFVLMQTTSAMRAAGEAAMPLTLLLLANFLNLGLDWNLLFGWPALGIPSFGVVGAAYATVASRALAAALGWWWLCRRDHALSLRAVPKGSAVAVGRRLLVDGAPLAGQIGLRASLVLVLTAFVQRRFGDEVTVAIGIATRLDTVILFGSLGFANAATAYVARAIAVGRRRQAIAAGLVAVGAAVLFGAAVLCASLTAVEGVVGWFLPAPVPVVTKAFAEYLGIAGWSQVLGAGALAAIGALHGAGRLRLPLLIDVLGVGWIAGCWWLLAGRAEAVSATYWALVAGSAGLLVLHAATIATGIWLPKWRSGRRPDLP
jgi:putative MATE family efflux protein